MYGGRLTPRNAPSRAARPQAKSAASSTSPREPSGDWRADLHLLARQQRAVLHHRWLIAALSHWQPLGPATLAYLEFTLGTLEPTGPAARTGLETAALINGFVAILVRSELTRAGWSPRRDRLAP